MPSTQILGDYCLIFLKFGQGNLREFSSFYVSCTDLFMHLLQENWEGGDMAGGLGPPSLPWPLQQQQQPSYSLLHILGTGMYMYTHTANSKRTSNYCETVPLKGECHKIFECWFFSSNSSSWSHKRCLHWDDFNFFRIFTWVRIRYTVHLLKGQRKIFDLAKSGIIGKILMSRAHGRPLKIFKVFLYIFNYYF